MEVLGERDSSKLVFEPTLYLIKWKEDQRNREKP